jgi:hypothetical protein
MQDNQPEEETVDSNQTIEALEQYIAARKRQAFDEFEGTLTAKGMINELSYIWLTPWEIFCLALGIVIKDIIKKLGI